MKIVILFLLASFKSFSGCINYVPESEAIKFHEAAKLGNGVAGQFSCEDKPNERCLCFDHCEGWDVCQVVDGKLENNIQLMQEKRAKKEVEENAKEIAKNKMLMATEKIKEFDSSKNYSNEEIKEFINAFSERLKNE